MISFYHTFIFTLNYIITRRISFPIFPFTLTRFISRNIFSIPDTKKVSESTPIFKSLLQNPLFFSSTHNLALSARKRIQHFRGNRDRIATIRDRRTFLPFFTHPSKSKEKRIDTILSSKVKVKKKKYIFSCSRRAHDGRKCGNR